MAFPNRIVHEVIKLITGKLPKGGVHASRYLKAGVTKKGLTTGKGPKTLTLLESGPTDPIVVQAVHDLLAQLLQHFQLANRL